jgi:hypothetical protein
MSNPWFALPMGAMQGFSKPSTRTRGVVYVESAINEALNISVMEIQELNLPLWVAPLKPRPDSLNGLVQYKHK